MLDDLSHLDSAFGLEGLILIRQRRRGLYHEEGRCDAYPALVLGVPLAIANIRTLYSWFPALKPAVANAIDVVTGYVPPAGPSLKVTHECR
jgi:hypothetical protein